MISWNPLLGLSGALTWSCTLFQQWCKASQASPEFTLTKRRCSEEFGTGEVRAASLRAVLAAAITKRGQPS